MHIILVSNHRAAAKTLKITPKLIAALVAAFVILSFITSFFFSWVGVRFNLPFAADLVAVVQQGQNRQTEEYVRNNLSMMAEKLGKMQAQVMRLDSLGERVAKISGINEQGTTRTENNNAANKDAYNKNTNKNTNTQDGQGGPLIARQPPLFSSAELQRELEHFSSLIEQRNETLTELESQLMERRIKSSLLPTLIPIQAARLASPFGYRSDPFVGIGAMHEGLDFSAPTGTPIIAAAGGVITLAEFHPQYGNIIEIDHGNDFSSRYAHLSQITVKKGQIIKRGQLIAESGNTGRSTGPHLHFEVRFKGVAQNPARFLQTTQQPVQQAAQKLLGQKEN